MRHSRNLLFTKVTSLNLDSFHREEGTAKDNFTCGANYKKKHDMCVRFPLGSHPMLRHFDASVVTGCNILVCT